MLSHEGEPKILFDFDYVWEVYKPGHQRKFGYYALPILWGDRLVGRFDSKLDRTTNTFVVLGLWLEGKFPGKDAAFAEALAQGFGRFVKFFRRGQAGRNGDPRPEAAPTHKQICSLVPAREMGH